MPAFFSNFELHRNQSPSVVFFISGKVLYPKLLDVHVAASSLQVQIGKVHLTVAWATICVTLASRSKVK